ncbi:MAG TPA: Crp/Fnr family transcriptional regulator [Burkholderiaceae bacterium]|nr:Crp/Fnr family transcriptional regulator [Burkholderiaceae bacterium]
MGQRSPDPATLLAALPLFKGLEAPALARLAAATQRRPLARSSVLFEHGAPASGMYVVVYGEIKLLSHTPVRGRRLAGVVGSGRSFGEPVMFLERQALVEARAGSDALLLFLPKQAVFDEIERNPKFARRMIAGLCQRIERLVGELDRQATGSGRERFIAYLLRGRVEGPGPLAITLPASKAEIASQLHVTPEHFSRILHELADAGLLQVSRRCITVPNPAQLAAAARPGTRSIDDVLSERKAIRGRAGRVVPRT